MLLPIDWEDPLCERRPSGGKPIRSPRGSSSYGYPRPGSSWNQPLDLYPMSPTTTIPDAGHRAARTPVSMMEGGGGSAAP
jgi:hypothetical protein